MINLTEIFPQTIQYTMGFDSHIVLGDPDSISNATGNKHNLIFYSSLTCYNQQYCQELQILTAEPKKGVFKKNKTGKTVSCATGQANLWDSLW
jgi:hypothetical protein